MTAAELVAEMTAAAPHLSSPQRVLVARFVGAIVAHGSVDLARADRNRRDRERQFEEEALAHAGDRIASARRAREPA